MLSLFPELLSFGLLAPLLLRLVVGMFLVGEGWKLLSRTRLSESAQHFYHEYDEFATLAFWLIGLCELVVGAFFVLGLFTQGAALVGLGLAFVLGRLSSHHSILAPHEKIVYRFLFVISASLLFLGAGAFGFDLPL